MRRGNAGSLVVAAVLMAGGLVMAQAPVKDAKPADTVARTPWGSPDLQGTWDYRTITPLQRPQDMGDRQFLTDAEAAQLESRAAKRLDEPPDGSVPANTIHAPYWTDPCRRVLDASA